MVRYDAKPRCSLRLGRTRYVLEGWPRAKGRWYSAWRSERRVCLHRLMRRDGFRVDGFHPFSFWLYRGDRSDGRPTYIPNTEPAKNTQLPRPWPGPIVVVSVPRPPRQSVHLEHCPNESPDCHLDRLPTFGIARSVWWCQEANSRRPVFVFAPSSSSPRTKRCVTLGRQGKEGGRAGRQTRDAVQVSHPSQIRHGATPASACPPPTTGEGRDALPV